MAVPIGTPWSDEERERLAMLLERGHSRRECAEALGRPLGSVRSVMSALGLRSRANGGDAATWARERPRTERNLEASSVRDGKYSCPSVPVVASEFAPRAASGSGPDLYSGGPGSSPGRGSPGQDTFRAQDVAPPTPVARDVQRLVDLCRTKGRSLRDVCDALDLSPRAAEQVLERARAAGYTVDVAGGEVAWTNPSLVEARTEAHIAPVAGEYKLGVMSDTHFGSKHCRPDWIADWVERAYSQGVRIIVHAGDMLAGQSEKIRWDLAEHGLDAQCRAAFEQLPQRPGLEYHFIDGNHDEHFWNLSGQLTGPRLVEHFKARGRHDLHCVGQRAGLVLLRIPACKRPVVVKLWHPKAGKSYALSYQPQNHIRDMAVGIKPDVLVCGHWHVGGYFEQRGVHAMLACTFEGPGSSFSQSLGGAVSNGANVVSFGVTEHGTIRDFVPARRSYYAEEHARELELSPGGLNVERSDATMAAALESLRSVLDALTKRAA